MTTVDDGSGGATVSARQDGEAGATKLRRVRWQVVLGPSETGRWIIGEAFSGAVPGNEVHTYVAYDVRAQADWHLPHIAKHHPDARVFDREELVGRFFVPCPRCRRIPSHGICACSYVDEGRP